MAQKDGGWRRGELGKERGGYMVRRARERLGSCLSGLMDGQEDGRKMHQPNDGKVWVQLEGCGW